MDLLKNSVLLLLALFCGNVNSLDQCPKGCDCVGLNINCTSPPFPITLPPRDIHMLTIHGDIQKIPKNAIVQPNGCNVTTVNFDSNHIGEIESFAFQGIFINIILFSTNITKINPMAFSNIECLLLKISNSAINMLPRFAFKNLRCGTLDIYQSYIAVIDTNAFSDLISNNTFISYNVILCIKASSLPASDTIVVFGNGINYFDPQNTDFFKQNNDFFSNVLLCTCSLAWILSLNITNKDYLGDNTCSGPPDLRGSRLKELNKTTLCNGTVSTLSPSQPCGTELPPSQPKPTPSNTPKTCTWNILLTIVIFAISPLILNCLS